MLNPAAFAASGQGHGGSRGGCTAFIFDKCLASGGTAQSTKCYIQSRPLCTGLVQTMRLRQVPDRCWFMAYLMLFLQGGVWSFQPRDAEAVEQAAAAAAAEAAEAAARQAFLQDWTAAVAAAAAQRPASVAEQQQQWLAGPHQHRVQALLVSAGVGCVDAVVPVLSCMGTNYLQCSICIGWQQQVAPLRIEVQYRLGAAAGSETSAGLQLCGDTNNGMSAYLQDYVIRPAGKPPKSSEGLARDTLALLKRRAEPEAAVVALQEAGLLQLHDPVPLLRLGHNAQGDFSQKLEQAAQVCSRCIVVQLAGTTLFWCG